MDKKLSGSLTFLIVLMVLSFFFSCGQQQDQEIRQQKSQEKKPMSTEQRPLHTIAPQARESYYSSPPEMIIDDSKKYTATIHTAKGQIVLELDAFYAPQHVNNFVFLARQGFYDGLTFHRHEPGFVIQGGDPLGVGTGGPGYRIRAEIGLPHGQGALAMARQSDQVNPQKKSSGSQFYITLTPQPGLDAQGYSVFGKVINGFEVVKQIRRGDVITRVDVEEK